MDLKKMCISLNTIYSTVHRIVPLQSSLQLSVVALTILECSSFSKHSLAFFDLFGNPLVISVGSSSSSNLPNVDIHQASVVLFYFFF